MDVVPVLDLQAGRAVHARRGERASYAPVAGVLGSGDDALALARAFRDRLGLRRLYVADLDALTGAAGLSPLLPALAEPSAELWVDAGVRTAWAAEAVLGAGAARAVVALETLPALERVREIVERLGAARVAFSLDLRGGHPLAADPAVAALDPATIAAEAVGAGADTILVIDIARAGSDAGPDLPLLQGVRAAVPDARLIAGGGVRDVADLEALADLGCAGALVATALHEGCVGRAEIERVRTTGSGR